MNLHYRSQCNHGHTHDTVQLAKSEPSFDRLIEQYIRSLFDEREVSDELKERLWAKYYNKLTKGLDKGYSPKLKHYDAELGAALKKNIAVFSAFKETSFREELEANLTDNGKFLPWSDFKKKAASISGDYNKRWLETEYHHTVANANMAKKWKRFQRDKDLYANLKYDAVNDNQTRAKHRAWDGVILPIDHPWWETHLPPNDWGCRCDAIQTDEPVTAEIPEGKIKAAFSNNPAKSGEVFTEIAYAKGLSAEDKNAVILFANFMAKRKDFKPLLRSLIKDRKARGFYSYLEVDPAIKDLSFDRAYVGDKGLLHATRDYKSNIGKTVDLEYLLKNMETDLLDVKYLFYDEPNKAYLLAVDYKERLLKYVFKAREKEGMKFITAGIFDLKDLSPKDNKKLYEKR